MQENKNQKQNFSIRKYFTGALNGMALGLFSSLIIGLILKQIGDFSGWSLLTTFGKYAQFLMGPAIGAGVAFALKAPPLGIFASIITGAIGAGTVKTGIDGSMLITIGEPVGAFISALIGAEVAKFISGKTKVDIVLVPAFTIIAGGIAGIFLSPLIASFMKWLGELINLAAVLQPIPMGIIISVLMGMILTLPISSAALAISLNLSGIAAGASVIGCSCQMIGFAVISYRENKFGGLIAQGLGTSMLQIPNLIKNPKIWIPPIIASMILGPLGTTLFQMKNNSVGAGMGTSGLVGQIGTFAAMGGGEDFLSILIKVILLHFIFPAIISLAVSEYMRKKGWIKSGDMKLAQL